MKSSRRLPPLHLRLATGLLSTGLLSTLGCAHSLDVQVQAGSCLNPMKSPCRDPAFDSRPVEVRFFPLNACPEPGSIPWGDLLETETAEKALAKFKLGGDQSLNIERIEKRELTFEKLPRGTQCVLAVVMGRSEGEFSVVGIATPRRSNAATFTLDGYDLKAPAASKSTLPLKK